jgi:hypothetical protein
LAVCYRFRLSSTPSIIETLLAGFSPLQLFFSTSIPVSHASSLTCNLFLSGSVHRLAALIRDTRATLLHNQRILVWLDETV